MGQRYILPFVLGLIAMPLAAQENIGMANGNYAGISGAWLNPSSIVDSRYKFDMAVFGYESFFTNNFLLVKNRTMVENLFRKDPYDGSFDLVKQDLLSPLEEMNGKVHAATISDIQLPFSFMTNLGPKAAIALNIRNRTRMSVDNLDPATAQMLYDNMLNPSLMGSPQDNSGLRFNYINWMEIGFTYGRVLVHSDHHFLKGAATVKLLAGNAAAFIASDDLQVTFQDTGVVDIQSPLIDYGRTDRADVDTYQRRNLLNGVEDYAVGWDIGFTYELRGKVENSRFVDLDNKEKERPDLNKYALRIGVALLDGGKFTFDRRELTRDHSANITGWDITQVNASDFDEFDEAYSKKVDYIPDAPSTFSYRLPTAFSANIDLHLFGGFYINAGTYRDATSLFKAATTTIHPQEWTAITPRFESRAFGLYVPVSRNDQVMRVGLTVRVGPFYFGSSNFGDQIANEKNVQADYHFGMRIPIGQGKPTALKRKFDAWHTAEGGIGKNSARLDSLEREVYALKMAADASHGTTIVNNYYGADSSMMRDTVTYRIESPATDQAAQRLKNDNAYLMDELARANMQQAKDSAFIANMEHGDEPDKAKARADRAAQKTAGKQADATADMAKQMEKINKKMRTQNAILAAGAATGVAAVAKSGDKEKPAPPASITAINDSMAVIGTDTVRMIAAPGTAVRVGPYAAVSTTGDTAIVTVHDTVHVTVNDTAHMQPKQPAVAPVNAADEKEMQRLMEPVYFATGSTTLGPQGRVKVEEIAAWLKKHPETRVSVTGFADASGSVSVNEAVADKRAASVRNELVKQGIEGARISTDRKLAEAGATPSAKDRRAEVKFAK